jgi:16S rRNA (uracil1498-N3)-methyltransferase
MHSFYDSSIQKSQQTHFLSEEESKHACKVLRLKENDEIILLNGNGVAFNARIASANPKQCEISIHSFTEQAVPTYSIHIAIAPTKNNDRIEWFLEKTTEIGITEITLLSCTNNERKTVNIERFEKILVSAMKQSKRLFKPVLHKLIPFPEFVAQHPNGLIAHCYDGEKRTISSAFSPLTCPILIGPEGDFTLKEVETAIAKGYQAISLGENRLRTETAGLVACVQAKQLVELVIK